MEKTLDLHVDTNGITAFLCTSTGDGKIRTMEIKNGHAANGQPFGEFIRAAIAQAEKSGYEVTTNFNPAIVEAIRGLG